MSYEMNEPKGMGPQAYVDFHAKDGSIDSKDALDTLNSKIQGLAYGMDRRYVDERDNVMDMKEHVTGAYSIGYMHQHGKDELNDTEKQVLQIYEDYGKHLADNQKADTKKLYESVYDIEVQLSALESSPDRAASGSKLSHDTVEMLGKDYADFVDEKTGSDKGTKRFDETQVFLHTERSHESLNLAIQNDLDAVKLRDSKNAMQKAHLNVYATMEQEGMPSGRLAEWVDDKTRHALEKSGYERTRAAMERQSSGQQSFLDKFRKPMEAGYAYGKGGHDKSRQEYAAIGKAMGALSEMRSVGSKEADITNPVLEERSYLCAGDDSFACVDSIKNKLQAVLQPQSESGKGLQRELPDSSLAGMNNAYINEKGAQAGYECS